MNDEEHAKTMPCRDAFPTIKEHPFKVVAFDWDGTAVQDRSASATLVTRAIEDVLKFGVHMVVITGTNFNNIDRQFSSHIKGSHKQNLFVCANRGSEVFGFDSRSEPVLLFRREATDKENKLLDEVAAAVKRDMESQSKVAVSIVYDRVNRRKIDLIPEWENPPKSQIGKLLRRTEERLRKGGFVRGIKGVFELTEQYAEKLGLSDTRITSDVKNIEVGLTDKSDSIRWITNELTKKRNIPFTDILILGDEFGPVAGFEGSDFRMFLPEEPGISYVSVGKEPDGVPEGVLHIGGGPACFVDLIKAQAELYRELSPTEETSFLLVERGYSPLREREIESLFTVSNGYLGTRGSLEEQERQSDPTTLVAGVYYKEKKDAIEELAVLPDWLFTHIYVAGRRLTLTHEHIIDHRRTLDMKKGILYREWRHRDESGRVTSISFSRFASLSDHHALALRITVFPENYRGEIRVRTGLKVSQKSFSSLKSVNMSAGQDGKGVRLTATAKESEITIAQAQISFVPEGFVKPDYEVKIDESAVVEDWSWQADMGQRVEIEKFVSIYTGRESANPAEEADKHVAKLAAMGINRLLLEHTAVWTERWKTAHVDVEFDPHALEWLNLAAYQLISAGNAEDDRISINARALTGTVYKGHIFWDTEMFILPFFCYTHPPTARAVLMYRYHTLPGARRKAAEMGYRGALFAWESATTGDEMTPTVVVAPTGEIIRIRSGELEQHISAAVAYGVWSYWLCTLDEEFLLGAGAEILFETARFWASRVEKRDGTYHIYNVEGPDEYHEGVNDNFYTNVMAAWNLKRAVKTFNYLKQSYPEKLSDLGSRIKLVDSEPDQWSDVAANIYRDIVDGNKLIEQFDGYFGLEDINVEDYEPRTAPLDVILGPKRARASQLVKQADVVMALYLLEDELTEEIIRKSFEYYDRRTGHGSSLSPSIYGLVAARLGLTEMAVKYLTQTGQIDLADNMGNAAGGVHIASLGGLWQQVIMGFAGIRFRESGVFVYPKLPQQWRRLAFSLLWRGLRLRVTIEREDKITLIAEGEGELEVGIYGRSLQKVRPGRGYVALWQEGTWLKFVEGE